MITGLPSEAESFSPRMRATRSLGPPVVTGTTILIGLAGQPPCAQAPTETHSARNDAANFIYVSPQLTVAPVSRTTLLHFSFSVRM